MNRPRLGDTVISVRMKPTSPENGAPETFIPLAIAFSHPKFFQYAVSSLPAVWGVTSVRFTASNGCTVMTIPAPPP